MYSKKLLDHFQNPRNVGELDNPDLRVEASNPICGDILQMTARISGGHIVEIRYLARGCTASIAVGSALTLMLAEKSAAQAAAITRDQISEAVGSLSNESQHAAVLAVDTIKALVRQMQVQS